MLSLVSDQIVTIAMCTVKKASLRFVSIVSSYRLTVEEKQGELSTRTLVAPQTLQCTMLVQGETYNCDRCDDHKCTQRAS
jgi:hypothetical protein